MEASHKSLLRKNRVRLSRELCLVEVSQILVEDEIMSDQMVEVINSKPSNFERNVAFLIKLPTRGPDAFAAFSEALRETGQGHLADLLSNPKHQCSRLNGLSGLKQYHSYNNTSEFSPSSFSFAQSTPLKPTVQPNDLNSGISSIHLTSPGSYLPMTNNQDGHILISKFPDITEQAKPIRVTPVEHLDISSLESQNLQSSSKLDSQFENLRSKTSIDVLRSSAGFGKDNHTSIATKENHILHTSSNHNMPSDITCKVQSGSIVSDAPTWENVTVRPTTVQFLEKRMRDCYPMFGFCKGIVLIISVTEFEDSACLDNRLGGERDFARLELMFRQLSYDVYNLVNGTARQIWNTLQNFSAWSRLADYSSCFIILMSHGEDGTIFGRDGKPVCLKDVFNLFSNEKCFYLQNKPKVFLTQACRGDQPDKGTDQIDGPTPEKLPRLSEEGQGKKVKRRLLDDDKNKIKLPTMSDCLFAYATVPGYTAMRNTEQGSWFIQAFIQVVAFHARDKSLLEIMTMTNNQMKAREGWSPATEFHRCKEMSEFTSCLCKPFYFFPGLHLEQIP